MSTSSSTGTSPADVAAALARLGSATVGESGGRAADRRLRPTWFGAAVAAPAYPVGCTPGDNLALHVAVTTAPRGSVLVVDVGQVADRGYWGEVLTTAAEVAGLAGLVLDGGVRDVAALRGARLSRLLGDDRASPAPARTSRGPSAPPCGWGASRWRRGTGSWPTSTAWRSCRSRRWTTCWRRGTRETKEAGFFEALKAGSTTLQLLGLDASLVRQG